VERDSTATAVPIDFGYPVCSNARGTCARRRIAAHKAFAARIRTQRTLPASVRQPSPCPANL